MNTDLNFGRQLWKHIQRFLVFRISVLVACLIPATGLPQVSTVTSCTEAALRAALASGGTVTFACEGTIMVTNTLIISTNTALDGGGHQVTIGGGNSVRVFYVTSNTTFSVNNLTIAYGRSTNGAAIYIDGGTLNASATAFQMNRALPGVGGAVWNSGIANFHNCTIWQNQAAGGENGVGLGGAVWNSGIANFYSCTIWNNGAAGGGNDPGGGYDGKGGAIFSSGMLSVSCCTIEQNSADGGSGLGGVPWGMNGGNGAGGGIYNLGQATITCSTFSHNWADGGRGTDSTVWWNGPGLGGTGYGGGLFNSGTATLENCTFEGNGASGGVNGLKSNQTGRADGSAIFYSAALTLRNCTIASNLCSSASADGGTIAGTGTVTLMNTILAYGTPSLRNCTALIYDYGHNLSSDNTPTFTSSSSRGNIDPKLGPLVDNGGLTLTMALLPGSPAIDAGDTSLAPATDQRGCQRPYGAAADIGAYEYLGSPFPLILTQPLSQTVAVYSSLEFTAAVGGQTPLTYQWFFDETNAIAGATTPDLKLPIAQPAQSGSYTLVVTNIFGAVTSVPARLVVIAEPPVILSPPLNQTADLGSAADFSVGAAGRPPLAYQWYFNGFPIPGANLTNLHLVDLQFAQSGGYSVAITNAFGAVTSPPAILTVVGVAPGILTSPRNEVAGPRGSARFSVTANGSPPLRYQWFFKATAIEGATTATLYLNDVRPSQAGVYFVVVTNLYGAVQSSSATLTVSTLPPADYPWGDIVAWGDNSQRQSTAPAASYGVVALAGGEAHTLALKCDGTVVAWGLNAAHQCATPANLRGVISLAAGNFHSLALKSDGTVAAWGDNSFGQSAVPAGLNGIMTIAGGYQHSLALKTNGTLIAWGRNLEGESSVPAGLNGVVAIAAGGYHSLALKSDGTVVGWGWDGYGQATAPPGLSGVVAVAAGLSHSLALKSDGTVVAWGANYAGEGAVPLGLASVKAIAARGKHNLALKSDGTVVAWGEDTSGQSTVPSGLGAVLAIAAGDEHSLALVAEPPTLDSPVVSQTTEAGSTVGFWMGGSGTPTLAYQWFFNANTAVSDVSTNAFLKLTNIQPAQAGVYSVVVSNCAGAVTSAPAMLAVIPPVHRRMVPGLNLVAQPGIPLNLDYAAALSPSPKWGTLDSIVMSNTTQWYFDLTTPLPSQEFYRVSQAQPSEAPPTLGLHMIPALTLTGAIGDSVRIDCINQVGPVDAWVNLATVRLTNNSQLYFDTSVIGQPPRLWRIVPAP